MKLIFRFPPGEHPHGAEQEGGCGRSGRQLPQVLPAEEPPPGRRHQSVHVLGSPAPVPIRGQLKDGRSVGFRVLELNIVVLPN